MFERLEDVGVGDFLAFEDGDSVGGFEDGDDGSEASGLLGDLKKLIDDLVGKLPELGDDGLDVGSGEFVQARDEIDASDDLLKLIAEFREIGGFAFGHEEGDRDAGLVMDGANDFERGRFGC